ncbi:hypothetical protein DFH09DRAFT_1454372 [Mycena vulgaris]|nr:hypothetical protein DFH09DRAFT_1454372 [Mycena vulgaris]
MAYNNGAYMNGFSQAPYLLGMGPLPPPTSREIAVAQMHAALNSGMFDQTRRFEDQHDSGEDSDSPAPSGPQYVPHIDPALLAQLPGPAQSAATTVSAATAPAVNLTLSLTVYGDPSKDKKAPTVTTTLVVPSDLSSEDFFSRVHAHMNVDPTTAQLGWKESLDRRRDPYNRLASGQDMRDAFTRLVALTKSRTKRAIVMEIVNLEVQPDGKPTKQAEKPSETAVTIPELRKVKEKLACAEHPGRNRWCYVLPPSSKHPGKHVPLDIEVIGLWARKMHDGEVDEDCVTPPNVLNLDELAERGRAREERTRISKPWGCWAALRSTTAVLCSAVVR